MDRTTLAVLVQIAERIAARRKAEAARVVVPFPARKEKSA